MEEVGEWKTWKPSDRWPSGSWPMRSDCRRPRAGRIARSLCPSVRKRSGRRTTRSQCSRHSHSGISILAIDRVTLSRQCDFEFDSCSGGTHFYAGLELPAGAVIDYIGVNTATTVAGAMGFTFHFRDHLGGSAQLASATLPTHDGGGFLTDYAGPVGIVIPDNHDREFLLDVEIAPGVEALQYFGFVEVWWRRTVSDPPATPTFADVPNGHPFYQFVEALGASGITGGCGDGSVYCPDAALTRGQMAVFLAKALGLHWPE